MRRFFKLSGGGNDFLGFAEPEAGLTPLEIRSWCRRGMSVGSDGVFVVRRDGLQVRMEHYNADGHPAALCLNGARCAARLAFHLGWAQGETTILTDSGSLDARSLDATTIEIEAPLPEARVRHRTVRLHDEDAAGWSVTVGVPHFVLLAEESLAVVPVTPLGRQLTHNPEFGSEGTNANFVRFPDSHQMEIRTFERGVEAETLACGTGVLAAAATGLYLKLAELPLRAQTWGGYVLEVRGRADGSTLHNWSITGDARLVALGDLLPEAGLEPPVPAWS